LDQWAKKNLLEPKSKTYQIAGIAQMEPPQKNLEVETLKKTISETIANELKNLKV
jgi:hypothetical protein